ncbi:hypothetical protein B0T26DRAFT_689209 [Lasiosphaeria miniovina]|uniref:Uncharacterized protein n=1 Tax=Lasiosphaeria miniovina TaxID=1954250 RepID=A0AA40EDS1_9PEZI|nr:uncharacterized protein B0T26DRAFT_689209 [Lasiosphaeria miniovina]KAK0734647.1 hypothetical protein B0T26DRAFT_689209 [Lasiosphaeria miniovina]
MFLADKVVLITGASKGIGRAVAERVADDGAKVVVNYLSDSKSAEEMVERIGSDNALAVQADVSKVADIERLVAAAVEKFGKIDVVMPNAGYMGMKDLAHSTEADYDRHFDLNVKGAAFLVQKAVAHMPTSGGGRVIFVSSGLTTSTNVSPAYVMYAASKGAVDQLTRVLAKDLARRNITVNAVAPGPTATELFFDGKCEQLVSAIKAASPFNRLGEPAEIASVVAFLAGPESAWVSGQVIRVNGANMV